MNGEGADEWNEMNGEGKIDSMFNIAESVIIKMILQKMILNIHQMSEKALSN